MSDTKEELKLLAELKKQQSELNKESKEYASINDEILKIKSKIKAELRTQSDLLSKSLDYEFDINSSVEKRHKTTIQQYSVDQKLITAKKESLAIQAQMLGQIDQGVQYSEDMIETYDNLSGIADNIGGLYASMGNELDDIVSKTYSVMDTSEIQKQIYYEQNEIQRKIADAIQSNDTGLLEQLKIQENILDSQNQQLKGFDIEQSKMEKKSKLMNESYNQISGISDKMFGMIQGMPGGGYISTALGLDKLKDKINESLIDGLQNGLGSGLKTLGGFNLALVASLGAVLAIGFAFKKVWDVITGISQAQTDIAREQGLSADEGQKQFEMAHKMAGATNDIWVNSEGMLEAMSDVRSQLGGMLPIGDQMNERTQKLVQNQMELTKHLGLSNDEATAFQDTAQVMGVSTDELLGSVGQVESVFEEMGGTTLNTKDILKEISQIPKGITAGFKGSTTELVRTVAKSKALGLSLEKIDGIGKGLLDIESSLQDEMEARVITGKNLNLDMARQLQLQGKTGELMDELLKQAGSYSEFKEMDSLQQESFAKAMGMTTDEMADMLQKAELQAQVGQDLANISADELDNKIKMGEIQGEEAIAMAQKLKSEKNVSSVTESMSAIWSKIQDVIMGIVAGPLGEIANQINAVLNDSDMIDGIMDSIKAAWSFISPIVSLIGSTIGFIFNILGKVLKVVGSIASFFAPVAKTTESVKDGVEKAESSFGGILTSVLAIGAGILLWKKFLKPALGTAKDFAGTLKDKAMSKFGMGGGDKATQSMDKTASKSAPKKGGGPGKIAKSFEKMDAKKMLAGAAAMLIVAAAVYVIAKAMVEFTKVTWDAVLMGIASMAALTLSVVALGMVMSSGVGTVAILAGAAAMLVIAASMWVLAKAMQEFGVAFQVLMPIFQIGFAMMGSIISTIGATMVAIAQVIGETITTIFGSIKELAMFEGAGANLMMIGAGLVSVSVGLAALTAGSIVSGIGSLFGGDSWIDQIKGMNDINGDNIVKIADSFDRLSESLAKLNGLDLDLSKVTEQVEGISKIMPEEMKTKISSKVEESEVVKVGNKDKMSSDMMSSENKISSKDSDMVTKETGTSEDPNTRIIGLLETLVAAVNQPVNINFNDQFVTKLDNVTSLKKQMRSSVDNQYGSQV